MYESNYSPSTWFFSLGEATGLGEGNTLNSKPVKLRLKIDLVLYTAGAEGLVKKGKSNVTHITLTTDHTWLHLCRWMRPHPNKCPGYGTKQSDGEAPVKEL